jgi:hypothetical protein
MKLTHFFLTNALVTLTSQAMHIEHSSTPIPFNGHKKALFEWIRDDRNNEFGKTAIIITTTNEPPFIKKGSVKTLDPDVFKLIAVGYSFYCANVKKKNGIAYGAIVINPEQHHFNSTIAQKICMHIRNAYIEKQLTKSLIESVALEGPKFEDNYQENSSKKDKKKQKQFDTRY